MASDVYYVENFKTVNWELPQWYAYKGLKLRHHNTYNLPLNRGRKISLYFSFTVGITIWPILFQERENHQGYYRASEMLVVSKRKQDTQRPNFTSGKISFKFTVHQKWPFSPSLLLVEKNGNVVDIRIFV